MAIFTLPGTVLGFRRDRSGAQLVKCTRDDGAPTLLMQPRPGGPPLYEKDIELHVSATKEFGLAVTVARSDGGAEHTLGDILGDACDNMDFAKQRKWTWWSGGIVRPEATAQPSTSAVSSSPNTSEVPKEPVPPSAPTASADMEAARVAAVLARRLTPLFVGGFAILVAAVGFLYFQHADLMALMTKQQGADNNPMLVNQRSKTVQTIGQRHLPLFDGQDRPPCYGVAQEKDGGCWIAIKAKPPCPETSFEKDGECWMPSTGNKKREPRSGESR